MSSAVALVTAVWSLVIAPALCWSGTPAGCCPPAATSDAVVDSCCGAGRTQPEDPAPAPEQPGRRSGDRDSCLLVCRNPVKTPDDKPDARALLPAAPALPDAGCVLTDIQPIPVPSALRPPARSNPSPYSAGPAPLLI